MSLTKCICSFNPVLGHLGRLNFKERCVQQVVLPEQLQHFVLGRRNAEEFFDSIVIPKRPVNQKSSEEWKHGIKTEHHGHSTFIQCMLWSMENQHV